MEIGFLLLVVASAAAGLALRAAVGPTLGRAFLRVGLCALILGLGTIALIALGRSPLGFWTGGLVAFVLLGAAARVVPFALAVTCGRA